MNNNFFIITSSKKYHFDKWKGEALEFSVVEDLSENTLGCSSGRDQSTENQFFFFLQEFIQM